MTKEKRKKIFMGMGIFAAIAISFFLYEHFRYVSTDNAQVEAHWVMIAAKVGGYVSKVNVVEGQKVKAGDILAEIDARDYENALLTTKSSLLAAEASRRESEKNYARISQLFKEGAVSQQQFDTATSNYSNAKARFDGLQAGVSQAELNLQNTQVKAPFDGFIAKKAVEQGQLAQPGVPLIGFVSASERWVSANFKETEIEHVHIGAKVYVSVDAISGQEFEGEVEAMSSATGATFSLLPPDNATGNFTKVVQRVPVKIKLKNLSEKEIEVLRAGLSAVVKVQR